MADKFIKLAQLSHFYDKTKEVFVAKEAGKKLSTNDYTTAEKTKLAGIAVGANRYELPTASVTTLGGVKGGGNVAISSTGVMSVDLSSYQTIADDSGISRRKVIDIISELVMFGCIKKTERRSNKGDHTANDYEVLIGRSDFSLPGETSAPQGNEYNSPPLKDKEVNKIIKSMIKKDLRGKVHGT